MAAPAYDLGKLRREEFPWAERGESIYLNNASTGPLPVRTVEAIERFTRLRAEPFRLTQEAQFSTLTRARELCARLIGAKPAEIALMGNTSYGLNLAARALPFDPGDEVLVHDGEFPANVYPWMALERAHGVRVRLLPLREGLVDEEALLAALQDARVRAVSVSWVSFSSGQRLDLATLGRMCRERGIYLVVDAIQGVGATDLDVSALEIDILACGGQKWLLAPWGTGFAYVRETLARALEPAVVGWMSVRGSDDFSRLCGYHLDYHPDARRFEMITLPFQDFVGLASSVELLLSLGPEAVAAHIERLASRMVEWALNRGMSVRTPVARTARAGIVSIVPPDVQVSSERLTRRGVAHSVREGAIRLSPHCYNTDEEIELALAALGG